MTLNVFLYALSHLLTHVHGSIRFPPKELLQQPQLALCAKNSSYVAVHSPQYAQ